MSTDFFTTDFSFLGSVEEQSQPSTKTTRRRQSKVREVAGVQYTVTRSPELVDKMVATRRQRSGYVVTEEHRAKISATLTGRSSKFKGMTGRYTDEQRAKMSANHRGGPQGKPVMTPNGIYPSIKAIVLASGYSRNVVSNWLKRYPNDYYFIKDKK